MKKRFYWIVVLAIASVLLGSCVPYDQPVPVRLKDGKLGYAVECLDLAHPFLGCLEKAKQICPGGYDIIDEETRPIVPASGNQGYVNSNQIENFHLMYIRCVK